MSVRYTRRAAELAVINNAIGYVRGSGATTYNQLVYAVNALEELGMDDQARPAFSNNSTDTSNEAGASVLGDVGPLCMKIFEEIELRHKVGGVGLTVDQLEQLMGRSHQSVSARVNDLMNRNWVHDSGLRRKTRSNRPAIVWAPTTWALAR